MFRQHVFARFTGALDPKHLHPWGDYYLRHSPAASGRALRLAGGRGSACCSPIGSRGGATGWPGQSLVWAVLPLALISALTSKLQHYAYPFFAPIALAGGLALAAPSSLLKEPLERLASQLERVRLCGLPAGLAARRAPRRARGDRRPGARRGGARVDRRHQQDRRRRRRGAEFIGDAAGRRRRAASRSHAPGGTRSRSCRSRSCRCCRTAPPGRR